MGNLIHMMEQVRKLKNGVGLQNLLDSVYSIIGNPLMLYNIEYKLLAYTHVATDDQYWNEIVSNGAFSDETLRIFENEGFIEDIANAPKIAFIESAKLKYSRIIGKIFNKNNSHVSNLEIIACNRPFDENDAIVFEAVCKLISKEVSGSVFYQEYEQSHMEAMIKKLIDGSYEKKRDIAHIGNIYLSLESALYVAVVDVSLCSADIEHCKDLLKNAQPAYKYAVYTDYILILISTNDEVLSVNRAFKELAPVFELNNMYAGISGKFENLYELSKHYTRALEATQFALDTRSSQRVFPCNERSVVKMEQINKLTNGAGIQYFLDIGPEIFGNPLLFHDMELNLLAYSKTAEICDPIWEELITYGTSSDETIKLFKDEGFINTMENTKGGAILISEKIKYDRISWRIYSSDSIMIGCLSIVNSITPFTEDELVLFGAFSRKFSKEVEKIEFYKNYGRLYSDTVINRLISGKIDDYTFYSEDIGNLYANLMENLHLFVIDTSRCESDTINVTYFRELFDWRDAVNRCAVYGNYIILIISVENALFDERKEFSEVCEVFERNNIYAGVSSCFENIYELQKHYLDAVSALTAGIKGNGQHGRQRLFRFDQTV